ncbi:HlyD family secretion protein (plasmid) [Sinorhizobium americanum CCGM7]|nr:hypothetical protein [Sinorhizobium americanum]APG88515.1 HlyD family secretion protein [Sinorhizobium americanum CCGM7]
MRGQRETDYEELKKMEFRREMVTLTAPADAVVLDLAQRSVGSVVRETEPIVTLAPCVTIDDVRIKFELTRFRHRIRFCPDYQPGRSNILCRPPINRHANKQKANGSPVGVADAVG